MDEKDLEIIAEALEQSDEIFTSYCDVIDEYIMDDEEIAELEDEEERDSAQSLKNYDTLLKKALEIVEKLKKGE